MSWNAPSGAMNYNMKRSTTRGSGYVTIASGRAATSSADTGLSNDTTDVGGEAQPRISYRLVVNA